MHSRSDITRTTASRVIVACSVLMPCLGDMAADAENRVAVLTSEQVRQRLGDLHAQLRTWLVEFESVPSDDPTTPPGAYLHRTLAARMPDQYHCRSAKGTERYSWRDDPFQRRLLINSSSCVHERPLDRAYSRWSLKPDDPMPGTTSQEILFAAFGWWPFEHRPSPTYRDSPCAFRDIARSAKYVVRPFQEQVDGRWCHVLEYPGRDRLWLDCQRNCTLLAREAVDPDTGDIVQRIELSKHAQIKPGLWVATEFRNIVYETGGQNEERIKQVDAVFRVLTAQINDPLPEELFRFEPRPGSLEILDNGRFEQSVPGGTEYLDELVDWIQRVPRRDSDVSVHDFPALTETVIECTASAICVVVILLQGRTRILRFRFTTANEKAVHL